MLFRTLLPLLLLCSVALPASVMVQFQYRFASGNTISGTIEGDLQPDNDLVKDLFNLNATYSPGPTFTYVSSFGADQLSLSGSKAIFFNGYSLPSNTSNTISNLGFYISSATSAGNGVVVGSFGTSLSGVNFPNPGIEKEPAVLSRWSASIVPTANAVPEPSSVALLFGAALLLGVLRSIQR